ncbi:MAG: DNA polymerase III subunit delta [Parvularcula sp.]|jgi:DNA polymerase-3 subunit delta|nr:DNA polymerase III subunit delta [Parvularcula sp.]
MAALKPRELEGFLKAPPEEVSLALVFGPEQGLVRERAERLAKAVAEDLSDPWRVISLSEQEAGDGGRLIDEAQAQSFLGGRRVVRVRGSGPGVTRAVQNLLDGLKAERIHSGGLVIVEAGDLKKTAALRKAAEGSPDAVAIACYAEGARDTLAAIRRQCADDGLSIENDAAELLTAALGDDRGLLRREVEKLILFKGFGEARESDRITAADVHACLAVVPGEDSFGIAALTFAGDRLGLSRALAEAEAAGTSVISLLRAAQGRAARLLPAAKALARGDSADAALRAIKPPVHFREADAVKRELARWPEPRLEDAARALFEAEALCKTTGAPDQALAERTLLRLAENALR